jgi:aspartyl-tRNA(Asn)/glutamyl-tRNA(Gln) amidotransferase subunit B
MPALPVTIRQQLISQGIPIKDAEVLVLDRQAYEYWVAAVQLYGDARIVTNWMLSDVARIINLRGETYGSASVKPSGLVDLLRLIDAGTLSGRMAKEVLEAMFETGQSAQKVVASKGLSQITDVEAIRQVVSEVVQQHAAVVQDYRSGKEKALAYLVGQVMKATRGQAKPDLVNQLLKEAMQSE